MTERFKLDCNICDRIPKALLLRLSLSFGSYYIGDISHSSIIHAQVFHNSDQYLHLLQNHLCHICLICPLAMIGAIIHVTQSSKYSFSQLTATHFFVNQTGDFSNFSREYPLANL